MKATGKSFSSVKKWRITVERLSGHEFEKVRMRVSRRRVQDVYRFTEEEFEKFVKLSDKIDETNNMAQSVTEIWGDLKAREERQLKEDVLKLKVDINSLIKSNNHKNILVTTLENRVKQLEEIIDDLKENQPRGLFSRKKK